MFHISPQKPSTVYLFVLLFVSCGIQPEENRIVRPVISAAFYEESTQRLEEMLQSDTANADYIRLQLSYYDKLAWPPVAQSAIARARESLTIDPVLARMYAKFYFSNARFQDLDGLFLELDSTFEEQIWMDRYKVKTYLEMNRPSEAVAALEQMLTHREVDNELAFWAGRSYLAAGDTASAFFYLLDARQDYALDEEFLKAYLPLALVQGKPNEVVTLAENYLFQRTASDEMRLLLAHFLYEAGAGRFAKTQVWGSLTREGLLLLSGWYESEGKWDSAHYCADRILVADSDDLVALLRKGDIDQRRGWLARASRYYNQVLALDSTNTRALREVELINRKIAYLRRIRAAQQEIPVLDLNRKKEIN